MSATDPLLRETELLRQIADLQDRIERWARSRELWDDAGFAVPFRHRKEAPSEFETVRMWYEGTLFRVFSGDWFDEDSDVDLQQEFADLVNSCGFEFEHEDHVSLSLYPEDEARRLDFLKLHRWQWIKDLADRRLYDLHAEVFEHFADDPMALKGLHWRQFEEFLDSVFRNQGFRTELGPGSGDGGVDLRIYQSEAIPEIVTIVQAKRYTDRPIGFEAVAALTTAAQLEYAPKALFATTSRYQPGARKFAQATTERVDFPQLQLVGPSEIGEWCGTISKQLSDYFASGDQPLPSVLTSARRTELTGKVVVSHDYRGGISNSFGVIEADFPHEAIIRRIGSTVVSGNRIIGTEVPDLSRITNDPAGRFVAFKQTKPDGDVAFWGNRQLYSVWKGQPESFDWND